MPITQKEKKYLKNKHKGGKIIAKELSMKATTQLTKLFHL